MSKSKRKSLVKYEHHGKLVVGYAEQVGKHRGSCLCYDCDLFKPGKEDNCEKADAVYKNCVDLDITTPVWECVDMKPIVTTKSGRPLIFAIVGESASGKSRIEEYIANKFGIDLIQSYTTRKKRPNELKIEKDGGRLNHEFLTDKEFDAINPANMIAYTQFGPKRYCCTYDNVKTINTYVIDEVGLKMLRSKHSADFDIVSIRVKCDAAERFRRCVSDVGEEAAADRMKRDEGMFVLPDTHFNHIIKTDTGNTNTEYVVNDFISRTLLNLTDYSPILIDEKAKF